MKSIVFAAFLFLFSSHAVFAGNNDIPESFKINGEYINPQCVYQLQTSLAEYTNVIIQSIVLETCQNSNLAFYGKENQWSDNNSVGYNNPDESYKPAQSFFYTYEGKLPNAKHLLSHGGSLAIYKITEKRFGFDVSKNDYRNIHILSKIAEIGFFHCFKKADISENTLIIKKRIYYPDNPHASACDENKTEQVKIDLSDILQVRYD